ncbi:MAG: hypothetical protein ACREVH_10830 [Gammaproteobacteria bacterium]
MLRAWHPTITRGPRLTERLRLDARILFVRRTDNAQPHPPGQRAGSTLLRTSAAAALLVAVIVVAGPIPYSESLIEGFQIDRWWRDGVLMQVSGYTLLGLSAIGLSLSARKRWRRLSRYSFQKWRLAHAVIGALSLVVLIAHTGLHLGVGLNLFLMLNYLALACAGAVLGYLTATTGTPLPSSVRQRWKPRAVALHLWLFWLFPVLTAFHILTVYWY